MNRFEQAVHDCMIPTAKLLDQTTNPLHRAMLLNFWRHVHLEGSGQFDRIVAPDMMVDQPLYRVTWGANPAVIEGKEGVLAFYNSVGEAVLWNSDDRLAVADWGICDELTFHQLASGSDLRALGYDVDDPAGLYHVSSRQAFVCPTTSAHGWPERTCTRTRPACASSRSTRRRAPPPRASARSTVSSWPHSSGNAETSSGC